MKRIGAIASMGVLYAASLLRAETASLDNAWEQASSFLFNDATESFRDAPAGVNQRERAFGEALSLMNYQPQTASNTAFALETFTRLAQENPNDHIGVLSRYFSGRIYQLHMRPTDEKKAAEIYEELIKSKTGNPLAENAASLIVLIKTYGTESEQIKTLEELEALAPYLSSKAGQRSFNLTMAYCYLDFGGRQNKETLAKALAHLQAAEKFGITRWQDEANLFLTTAEVARLLGDNKLAVEYYGKFVNKYKRDSRNYYARKEIEELSAAPAQP